MCWVEIPAAVNLPALRKSPLTLLSFASEMLSSFNAFPASSRPVFVPYTPLTLPGCLFLPQFNSDVLSFSIAKCSLLFEVFTLIHDYLLPAAVSPFGRKIISHFMKNCQKFCYYKSCPCHSLPQCSQALWFDSSLLSYRRDSSGGKQFEPVITPFLLG